MPSSFLQSLDQLRTFPAWPSRKSPRGLKQLTFPDGMYWLEPAMLQHYGKMIIGGEASIGKSLFLLELAYALSTGAQPFGCPTFAVPKPMKVLLLEKEVMEPGLHKRIGKMFSDEECGKMEGQLEIVTGYPGMNIDDDGMDFIRWNINNLGANILIMDPLAKFHNKDENAAAEIGQALGEIDKLRWEFKGQQLAVIWSHHFGKPSGDPRVRRDPLDTYNFRGSSRFKDDPDTKVTLAKLGSVMFGDHKGWLLGSSWVPRHGEEISSMFFTVNRKGDLRVRYVSPDEVKAMLEQDLVSVGGRSPIEEEIWGMVGGLAGTGGSRKGKAAGKDPDGDDPKCKVMSNADKERAKENERRMFGGDAIGRELGVVAKLKEDLRAGEKDGKVLGVFLE